MDDTLKCMLIKEMSPEERPRERLEKNGVGALSNAELLAVILQKGTRQENVIDLSNKLISKFGLDRLEACSLSELMTINGVGKAKAMQIKALFEFTKRCSFSKVSGKVIRCAKDVFEYASPKLSDADREYFMVLHLDTKNRVIKDEIVSVGALNGTMAHPREVFKSAIRDSANSVILVHNHPSGNPEPSDNDNDMIERFFEAGEVLGIYVLDQVIVGKENWWSLKEKNNY